MLSLLMLLEMPCCRLFTARTRVTPADDAAMLMLPLAAADADAAGMRIPGCHIHRHIISDDYAMPLMLPLSEPFIDVASFRHFIFERADDDLRLLLCLLHRCSLIFLFFFFLMSLPMMPATPPLLMPPPPLRCCRCALPPPLLILPDDTR